MKDGSIDAPEWPLSYVCALVCCSHHVPSRVAQIPCPGCGVWKKKRSSGNKLCWPCEKKHHEEPSVVVPPATAAPAPLPLFERETSTHSHLSTEQRWSIVLLHKQTRDNAAIAKEVSCDVRSVRHWLDHYEHHGSVEDAPRSGRKRKAPEQTHRLVAAAKAQPFTTPRSLRRELELDDLSARSIRRRLDDAGLHGRVAKSEHPFTEEHLRKRLSFAEGYANWSEEKWDTVLFTDEARIEQGPHGRVWVQRPAGQALNPRYMTRKRSHPPSVAMWGCFSAAGVGEMHLFQGSLYAVDLRRIYAEHLLPSALRFWPRGQWWLLHDGDKRHASEEVTTWLFNKGVQSLEWPPYSPDLNPIENVWADLKKRVEQRNPANIKQLETVVKDEWKRTNPILLAHLAHSMPQRCRAVIANHGHRTSY